MRSAAAALALLLAATSAQAAPRTAPVPAVENLRVEYFQSPLAIGTQQPRFSWELPSTGLARGVGQKSYSITVVQMYTDFGPVWNSGLVESDRTHGIELAVGLTVGHVSVC